MNKTAIRLHAARDRAETALQNFQAKCPHERKHVEHKYVADNPDPGDHMYWDDITCLDCGKTWSSKVTH